jgi:hypothetical protein
MMVLIIVHALYSPESTSDITWCTMIMKESSKKIRNACNYWGGDYCLAQISYRFNRLIADIIY